MKGLNCYMGSFTPWINPVTNTVTTYVYSGDPESGSGWLDPWGGEARFWLSTGPVNVQPNDTVDLVIAQLIAKGTSNYNSVSLLKQYAQEVRNYYRNCFAGVPIGITQNSTQIPNRFELYQNYPNPFNPRTIIKFSIPNSNPPLAPKGGQDIRLIIYDAIGREVTLINKSARIGLQPGTYEVEFDGTNYASGVYYYSLIVGNQIIGTRKMVLLK